MTERRYRCVQGRGHSRWFADADVLRDAYRNGTVSGDAIVFDAEADRWYNLEDHDAVKGVEVLPSTPRQTRGQGPRTSTRPTQAESTGRVEIVKPGASGSGTSQRRWQRFAVFLAAAVVIALTYTQATNETSGGPRSSPSPGLPEPGRSGVINPPVGTKVTLEGLVANHGTPAVPVPPVTGSVSLALGSPDLSKGDLVIGAPLGGSGRVASMFWADSLMLLSISAAGDTIVWLAALEGARLSGSYSILGGLSAGQGGRWWLSISPSTLDALRRFPSKPDSGAIHFVKRVVAPFWEFPSP